MQNVMTRTILLPLALLISASCALRQAFDPAEDNPNNVAVISVYEPFDERDLPIEVVVPWGASEELKAAVKHVQVRDWEKALESLDVALSAEKPEADAYLLKALILEHQGEWSQAQGAYREANFVESSEKAQAGLNRVEASMEMDTEG